MAFLAWICNQQIEAFLDVCKQINFPVALDKTFWASTTITFLGMLLDTQKQIISIPAEKIQKALDQIYQLTKSKKRKATVLQIQKLSGLLNFICCAVMPGRPFLCRLYRCLSGFMEIKKLLPHHHVKIPKDVMLDMEVWKLFLESSEVYSRPFIDLDSYTHAEELDWFTDSAKAVGKGFGGHHNEEWFQGLWDEEFLKLKDLRIEFLELYAVAIGVLLWMKKYRNQRIVLFCDNQSVVWMINKMSSKCPNCMTLIRLLTIESLMSNIRIYAKHVRTKLNG